MPWTTWVFPHQRRRWQCPDDRYFLPRWTVRRHLTVCGHHAAIEDNRSEPLFFRCEGQEHVAGHTAEARITGVDEDHSGDHHGAGTVERSAAALDSIHGLVIAGGVHVPQNL